MEHRRSKPRAEWEVRRRRILVARSSKLRTGETQYIVDGGTSAVAPAFAEQILPPEFPSLARGACGPGGGREHGRSPFQKGKLFDAPTLRARGKLAAGEKL